MAKETFVRSKPRLLEEKANELVSQAQSSIESGAQQVVAAAHDCCDTLLSVAEVLARLSA